jgi:hypothetical protein
MPGLLTTANRHQERDYLRNMLSRRQLQDFVGPHPKKGQTERDVFASSNSTT